MREIRTRVKTAKGRKLGSKLWLERQLNDPFVKKAKAENFRSRAVYKLKEIDEKTAIFKRGMKVIDLGAAPGSWMQYAIKKNCEVTGIDLLEIKPMAGAKIIQGDFLDDAVLPLLEGEYDIVMSDMAANSSGYPNVDHMRVMELVETAFLFCQQHLKKGGHFVAKILMGGHEIQFGKDIRKHFETVKFVKPEASRSDSSETYIVGISYKG
jgi:23S rRNA (uridine2552-2'-O)-methyltransferase